MPEWGDFVGSGRKVDRHAGDRWSTPRERTAASASAGVTTGDCCRDCGQEGRAFCGGCCSGIGGDFGWHIKRFGEQICRRKLLVDQRQVRANSTIENVDGDRVDGLFAGCQLVDEECDAGRFPHPV